MTDQQQTLETLRDIRSMMDRSSRFISLSGWSGVAAGTCALAGAWYANNLIHEATTAGHFRGAYTTGMANMDVSLDAYVGFMPLLMLAVLTLAAAVLSAFLFTWMRSRKSGTPVWGPTSRRLLWALAVPLAIGGVYMVKVLQWGAFGLIAPGCLFFYGLGLISASRYTLGEIKWLGYAQLIVGLVSLWYTGYGLYFWALGFGVLHIVYGLIMWWKHERNIETV